MLTISIDDRVLAANISIRIGLIATELVINALKHAFPEHRHGNRGNDFATDNFSNALISINRFDRTVC